MGCLYQIKFGNGKSYIGITIESIVKRFKRHLKEARGNRTKYAIHAALRKYPDQYEVKELAWSEDWKVLCKAEQIAIKEFCTKVPHGYNMTDGGEGTYGLSFYPSEESRKKMSIARMGVSPTNKGVPHTKEEKQRISLSLLGNQNTKGFKHSEETKKKMSIAHVGNKSNSGRGLTAEHKSNISKGLCGKKRIFTVEHRRNLSKAALKLGSKKCGKNYVVSE